MNIAQIESNLQKISKPFNTESFIYDLLLAYGQPKASIKRLQQGGLNLSKTEGEILWKKKLFFKSVKGEDLHELIDTIKADDKALKHDPRFIIVTDFETLLAIDRKTSDTLDIPILDIAKHFDFFLPWAGMEKAQHQNENPADVKAAERMAKLYDEIKKDNPTKTSEEVHNLNVFLSRLLFCFFAEDTGIFEKVQFTNAISSHTQADGSDLQEYLDKLFVVMNTENGKRKNLPHYLDAFPYVNGGLFRNPHHAPVFTRRSRQALIDSGQLQWKDINPDIFGSMIQAVITPEHRGGLGMHYTSVPNIMKVIEPLFLNELNEAFEAAKGLPARQAGNSKVLNQLLQRIWNIKLFDPACGSGNFLIIAYKELRKLEIKIFKELDALIGKLGSGKIDFGKDSHSNVALGNFYGIEIDDFAHEIATLSLWLAEHQMNQEFFKEFGRTRPALPLQETGNIVQGNATRVDWEKVCPKKETDEIYILGNPPYLGARVLDEKQKSDMEFVFKDKIEGYNDLDYIANWFFKATNFIRNYNCKAAFVSTNSISQGSQVSSLWPSLLKDNIEIDFVHEAFKWTNNAKSNAAVIVIILGLRNISSAPKFIYNSKIRKQAKNISPYLVPGQNIFVYGRRTPISDLPEIDFGNMPNDGGHLLLNENEYNSLIQLAPEAKKFLRRFIGSKDFINEIPRWCLWIEETQQAEANEIDFIRHRIAKVKTTRQASDRPATVKNAKIAYRFVEIRHKNSDALIIPRHSSERRKYIPIGFLTSETIIADSALAIYEIEPWHFAIITSKMHMTWVRAVCGRLKSDYRYSASLCYNTFPFPEISLVRKQELQNYVFRILEERESNSEKTLAHLYDPDKMPAGLQEAHNQNDLAVERCYRSKLFESDEERLE